MDIVELKTFVKVVQAGSFTLAAEALNSHKAQVSRTVSQLEKKLKVQLLQRNTRSLHLTEVGREVYERAIGILAAIDDTKALLAQHQSEPTGVLRLTCSIEFGMVAVNAWIAAYLQRYPQMQIEADCTPRVVDIIHEGFDIAIRVGELTDSNLAARKIGALKYGLFASEGYFKRRGMPQNAADLKQHDVLMFKLEQQKNGWKLSHQTHETVWVDAPPRLIVNNRYALLDAVRADLGIAALPLVMSDTPMVRILPDWELPEVPIHAVFPSTRYLTPKVRSFIDLAIGEFAHATKSMS